MRKMGKLSFVKIRDIEGDMQLEIKIAGIAITLMIRGLKAYISPITRTLLNYQKWQGLPEERH